MHKLIDNRICDIILLLLLVWTFFLFHTFSKMVNANIWMEAVLFTTLVFYSLMMRNKCMLEKDPDLRKYLLPLCKPTEWLFEKCHSFWDRVGFLKIEVVKISKNQYEKTYPILTVLGNFMIILFLQLAHWSSPIELVANLMIVTLLFLIGGFISYSDLELSLRLAVKIAIRYKI